MADDGKAVSDGRKTLLQGVVGGRIVKVEPMNSVDVREMWWAASPWAGSEAESRNRKVLSGEVLCAQSGDVPDALLRMVNPRCVHDRCSETIMNCVECKVWTEAHWADKRHMAIDDEKRKNDRR